MIWRGDSLPAARSAGALTAGTNARPAYSAAWFDGVGRTVARGAYGNQGQGNDSMAFTRPTSPPDSSDTILVGTTIYNSGGKVSTSIDPAGIINFQEYDNAGRGVRSIANYQTGAAAAAGDANVTTETTYNPDGKVATLTAKNPDTGDQTTYYEYGVVEFDESDPPLLIIATNDLLRATIYPDSVDGGDQVKYTYNRQGQTTGVTDQNGSIHAFTFDLLGRPLTDIVSTVGSDVDAGVERIDRAYEVRGMVNLVTSYADTTTGTKVNEVTLTHNDFAQLESDEQDHSGAGGSQPTVQYAYVDGTGNTTRRTSVTYPNTNELTYSYAGTDANKLSRVEKLTFNSSGAVEVVDYTYFGLSGVAKTNYPQPGASSTMASGSSFSGFDRFGRVIDLPWTKTTSGDLAQLRYGYDRVSSRTYRQDVKATAVGKKFDELYGYDNLQRLTAFDRGTLDATSLDRITTLTQRQSWQLDPTGNWNGFKNYDDQGGAFYALDQTRTQNAANEITSIGATVGEIWKTPAHDRNGNMTTMPQLGVPAMGYDGKYDAWNRLVELTETTGGLKDAEYEYDGLNRRTIRKHYNPPGTLDETRDYYYSDTWQVLEEQVSSVAKEQFVWGLRYIDDLVLRDRSVSGTLDERLYALQDANWNVVALTNTSGAVQMRLVYEAYGTSTALKDNFTFYSGGPDYQWEYRFTGRRLDIETGLYYYRARYFHTALGRFISQDPSGFIDGVNRFAYVANNPIVRFDASGKEWTIKREGGVRANVTSEPDDTVEDLAKMLNFDADQYNVWLKADKGKWDAFPTTKTAKIGARATFHVPNTVFVGVGSMNRVAWRATGNTPANIRDALKKKGYAVVYNDYTIGRWSGDDLKNARGLTNDLYGLVFFGHGVGLPVKFWTVFDLFIDDSQKGDLKVNGTYIPSGMFKRRELPLLILKSCNAKQGKWPDKATDAAKNAGTVWLGSGAEVPGITPGMMKAVDAVPGP